MRNHARGQPEFSNVPEQAAELLTDLGVAREAFENGEIEARSPITGEIIGRISGTGQSEADATIKAAHSAFLEWRKVPAPRRGELVRLLGEELRANKGALGRLVTIETGKIISEGLGEVQE